LIKDYARLLREMKAKELSRHQNEIKNYKNLMKEKLDNEKKVFTFCPTSILNKK